MPIVSVGRIKESTALVGIHTYMAVDGPFNVLSTARIIVLHYIVGRGVHGCVVYTGWAFDF